MQDYSYSISTILKYVSTRIQWYENTGNKDYLCEAMEWMEIVGIYMKEINQ